MNNCVYRIILTCGLWLLVLGGSVPAMNPGGCMKIVMEKTAYRFPEPVVIQVYLYSPHPIAGAGVSAVATSPSGKRFTVPFSEDRTVGNMIPRSGGYAGILTELNEDGNYVVHIRADDNQGRAHMAGGFLQERPEPEPADQPHVKTVAAPFVFEEDVSIHLTGYAGRAVMPPLKINTLYGEADEENCVHLTWIIPQNVKAGARFEIRRSSQNIVSEQAWAEATKIINKKYTGKGGETQKQKICNLAKGAFCFAVRSTFGQGLQSDISNNYRIVIR